MEQKIKDEIIRMLKEISGANNLIEARAECLYSAHLWEYHLARKFNLTPTQMADFAFTLGRASQLGVLFGILWWSNDVEDVVELKAKELYAEALKTGKPSWRLEE